ncbi:unnamed protein product [Pleuronectes platessa]|uniref:Uncharacterized protein n=1 Tax=Pleuronectes platessa TaxID=8262 RepID=A0A9N7YTF8_PLEPL|nr:unnamed protein product [Pleuronectes platessa]
MEGRTGPVRYTCLQTGEGGIKEELQWVSPKSFFSWVPRQDLGIVARSATRSFLETAATAAAERRRTHHLTVIDVLSAGRRPAAGDHGNIRRAETRTSC